MVELLIKKDADVDAKNIYGWTPLHYASRDNEFKKAYCLLESGADPNVASNDSWTPILLTSYNNHSDLIKLLYFYGAKLPDNVEDFRYNWYQDDKIIPTTQIDTAISRLANSYAYDSLSKQFWQLESRLSLGIGAVPDKLFQSNIGTTIIPQYKSFIGVNRFLSPHFGVGLRIDGVSFNVSISMSKSHINSISQEEAFSNDLKEYPFFGLQPNLGLLYYFRPQSYSYFRIGIAAGNFLGPYLVKDSYYYDQVGGFVALNGELRLATWNNSFSFESSFYYSKTKLDVAGLDATGSLPMVQRQGNLFWYDVTLRYMPFPNTGTVTISPSFFFSFRNVYGGADGFPRFSLSMINLGLEIVFLNSIGDLLGVLEREGK
jgi:hypothetical protein